MLSEHLDWTESLGWAYSVQPADVGNVIQLLRSKAEAVGNLKSTTEQIVTTREEGGSKVIYIVPANPERIYVPVYDSSLVFSSALTGALVFGTAVLVGSTWNNRWGWNNRSWNQVWINPPGGWRPGRPGVRPPGAWRPDRPGVRPDRPGARPERPGVRPERPSARPQRPQGARPQLEQARPPQQRAQSHQPRARSQGARPQQPRTRSQPAARSQGRGRTQ